MDKILELLNSQPPEPERVKVKALILNAKYHPLEKGVIVAVRLPNGRAISHPILVATFKELVNAPPEVIDREMERMAEGYRRHASLHHHIDIVVDKNVLE